MLRASPQRSWVFGEWLTLQPLVPLAIAASLGVTIDAWLKPPTLVWGVLFGLAVTGFAIGPAFKPVFGPPARLATLILIAISSMGFWHQRRADAFAEDDLARWLTDDWQPVIVRATVRRPTDYRRVIPRGSQEPWQSIVDLRYDAFRRTDQWIPCQGRGRLLVDGRIAPLLPGDRLEIRGRGQRIGPPTNPGEFDLRRSARRRDQLSRLTADSPSDVVRLEDSTWVPGRWLAALSVRARAALTDAVGADERGDLVAALVLGYRESIDRELIDQLVETGTIHMLAISGLHLGLVTAAVAALAMAAGVGRRPQLLITLAAAVLYAMLVGAQPPVVRAACLVSAVVLARWSGRPRSSANLLAAAALFLLWIDPRQLLQTGTQLSFLAVATLSTMSPLPRLQQPYPSQRRPLPQSALKRFFQHAWNRSRVALAISGWVCLITAPLIWYQFHVISPISVVANLLLGPPLFVALLSGLSAGLIGVVSTLCALPFGWLAARSVDLMLVLVQALSLVPGGHAWLPAPALWQVIAFYGVLGILVAARVHESARGRRITFMILMSALSLMVAHVWWSSRRAARTDAVVATFVDVGHGTSVLLQMPDGRTWLYDAGGLADGDRCAQAIAGVLWHAGRMRLDGIVISHADFDHFSAIPKLLERFHVAEVIMPPGFFQSAGPQVHAVASALARHAVPAMELHRTSDVQQIACLRTDPNGFCKLTVRHPRRDDPRGDQNAGSIVLELQVGKNVLILPGDLEPPGSADVLQQPPPNPGGCLMAAHHGSLEGDPRALIDWAQPSLVVISGGNRAKRPNVERMYQPANGRLWITARNGAIQVVLPARGKMISSGWLSEPW